jgi:putative two-component system response regulator
LEKLVKQRTEELNNSRLEIIHRLGIAAEFKDNKTGLHVQRMSLFAKLLASKTCSNKGSELIFNAAPMHDVGKIGIPDSILIKPGKLNDKEWEVMKKHPIYGAEIIGEHSSPLLKMAKEIALYHHERWDGKGYPNGVSGKDIPIWARIVSIADVFDALTSPRPYKRAWSIEEAVTYLKDESGKHFDPELVPIFLESMEEIYEIVEQYQSETVYTEAS